MPTTTQLGNIQNALAQIKLAIPPAQAAVGATADPDAKYQLTLAEIQLVNTQTTLTQALIAADDTVFATDTEKLKALAEVLLEQAAKFKKIVADVDTGVRIAGYIAEAAKFIAAI